MRAEDMHEWMVRLAVTVSRLDSRLHRIERELGLERYTEHVNDEYLALPEPKSLPSFKTLTQPRLI